MGLEAVTFTDDLVVTNPISSDPRSEGDDHLRNIKTAVKNTFPGMVGRAWRIQSKGAGYTAVTTDNMSVLDASAAFTLALTAAATLGNGWMALVYARSGNVVVDPNGGELVNGVATVTIPQGWIGTLICTGTEFHLAMQQAVGTTLSPSSFSTPQNDYSPSGLATAKVLRIGATARTNVTGLALGSDQRALTVHNIGEYPIDFTYEDAASAAANRFAFGYSLGGGQSMKLIYDGTSSRWRADALPEARVGEIKDHAGTIVPPGWLACDGTAVSRTTYVALFREVGTTWGVGDGTTTFNVPDFCRKTAVGSGGTGTGTLGNAVGNSGGEEDHTLTEAESALKTHSHSVPSLSVSATATINTRTTHDAGDGNATIQGASAGAAGTQNASVSGSTGTGTTGNANASASAHNNLQPSAVVLKIIKF